MATRKRTTKSKADPALVARFGNHRIWHFIRNATAKSEDTITFHHPVGRQASANYEQLFTLLRSVGLEVWPQVPESGLGQGVGMVRINGILKMGSVVWL